MRKHPNVEKPGLFGLKFSNRDFSKAESWGKNQFNSAFPASLACYMHFTNIPPVYMTLNEQGELVKGNITVDSLFDIDPLGDDVFFLFESQFSPYGQLVSGKVPAIDLVIMQRSNSLNLRGLEVKLTALPDNSTHHLTDDQYGCEIVVRPDTIVYLALSIASVELTKPRIKREEIRNIILGNGHLLLSPERRLDAVILNTPDLFE
jgi:hypothetical protein